jgi:predicted amidophosphoribosyltransferase
MRDPTTLWHQRAIGALWLFVPPFCVGCRRALTPTRRPSGPNRQGIEALCITCERQLDLLPPHQPIARTIASPLAATHACFGYSGSGADWVHRLKGNGGGLSSLDPDMLSFIDAVAERMINCAPWPDCIVPVAMHTRQLQGRGFNPAGRFARALARATRTRIDERSLTKVRETRPQKGLGRHERQRNVEDAFAFRTRSGSLCHVPESVWLVDDVVTTGATLAACARSLRDAGVSRIVGVCMANTPATMGEGVRPG